MQKKQLQNCQEQKQNENHKPNIWGKTRGKLTFCVRRLEEKRNKTKAKIKTICIIKQKQLIVTRMCND